MPSSLSRGPAPSTDRPPGGVEADIISGWRLGETLVWGCTRSRMSSLCGSPIPEPPLLQSQNHGLDGGKAPSASHNHTPHLRLSSPKNRGLTGTLRVPWALRAQPPSRLDRLRMGFSPTGPQSESLLANLGQLHASTDAS